MDFKEIIAVTAVSGLKRLVANRNDGLILSDLDGDNKKFFSSRQHMFSPLENIAIYTDEDTVPLFDVMQEMRKQKSINPPVAPNASNDELRGYLSKILPNYDKERVNISDIKKLVKWFLILDETDVLDIKATKEDSAA